MPSRRGVGRNAAKPALRRCTRETAQYGLTPYCALFRLQRLALGDTGHVEALEVLVALVDFVPDPDEQVVEGVLAVAQGQPLDRLERPAPLAVETGEVVKEGKSP